jgi:hypothetical protein
MKKFLKLCIDVIEHCVKLGIDGGGLFVHGEEVVFKLSVGVGELFVHGVTLCVELFEPRVLRFSIPRHGHKAKSILWNVRWLENYN